MIELLKPGDLIRMVIRTAWREGIAVLRVTAVCRQPGVPTYIRTMDVSNPVRELIYSEYDLDERRAVVFQGRKCPKRKDLL